MKNIVIIIISLVFSIQMEAQDMLGSWIGSINVQGHTLRIGFNFTEENGKTKVTMDSPDQKAFGIPAQLNTFTASKIEVSISNMRVNYTGKLNKEGVIEGHFNQAGQNFELNLTKTLKEESKNLRPQHPNQPYPYNAEDVSFVNAKDGIKLSGTFTFPKTGSNFTTVILITGSGPQNRDEEIMGHKPFLVLSDHLTQKGFAVLRYDDRGTYGSEGDFSKATSKDFATDVNAAIEFLKTRAEVNKEHIGLIGHSEGGLIAPMVAQHNTDVAFLVLLAGTGVDGKTILLDQTEEMNRLEGMKEDENRKAMTFSADVFTYIEENVPELTKEKLKAFMVEKLKDKNGFQLPAGEDENKFITSQVNQLTSPWMKYFLFYDPVKTLEKISVPVLAINGSKDIQVKSQLNLPAIKKALNKKKHASTKVEELQGLNHLFQECKTGSVSEYQKIEQTFSPKALAVISDWMLGL
ncbi:MAG: alpha/beta hydrolase family protein [Flavobacteriales bacterium]